MLEIFLGDGPLIPPGYAYAKKHNQLNSQFLSDRKRTLCINIELMKPNTDANTDQMQNSEWCFSLGELQT